MFIPTQSPITLISSGRKFFFLSILFVFFYEPIFASTKTWTGLAGDGKWSSSANWNGNVVPGTSDDVFLDNSLLAGSFTITLPNSAIVVRTVTIAPGGNNSIELVLPTSNTQVPAFTATGPGYGMVINNGGIFSNSSGASAGTPVNISDSIRINNGGKFIHNTQRSHSANVAVLSRMPGTETGIFEFNIPGTQSYTVSITNRIYGTLVFNADASPGGTRTYLGSGSNALTIRGNLQIGVGVTLKIDLATNKGNINLNGDFIQNGGVLDLASGPDSSIFTIKGNLTQSSGSVITESSTGLPAIELNGSSQQSIFLQGAISNNITFRMNNAAGAILQSSLSLPYKLELLKGNITTSSDNLLILQSGSAISIDSTIANNGFINGPLRKEGLSGADHFLFPVGKSGQFRWLELKNTTGNFNVEFIAADARNLSTSYGNGIDHISSHGYWSVDADINPLPSAKVELSFADATGSGVTDMSTLKVSQLSSGVWIDRNNAATTGTPGAAGSVVSENITAFNSAAKDFVLASSVPNENPLPVILTSFTVSKINDDVELNWGVASSGDIDYFEIWSAVEINNFKKTVSIRALSNETSYQFVDKRTLNGIRYYKLRIAEKDGNSFFSKIIAVKNVDNAFKVISIAPSVVYDNATVFVYANERTQVQCIITGIDGKIINRRLFNAEKGNNRILCDFSGLAAGVYVLSWFDSKGNVGLVRFIKL